MTFKLFGYIIGIETKAANHARKVSPPLCKITSDGKHYLLTMPNGDIVPKQLHCTILERLNEAPRARIELYVDLTELGMKTKTE